MILRKFTVLTCYLTKICFISWYENMRLGTSLHMASHVVAVTTSLNMDTTRDVMITLTFDLPTPLPPEQLTCGWIDLHPTYESELVSLQMMITLIS